VEQETGHHAASAFRSNGLCGEDTTKEKQYEVE
jgi:hypothetical protein